MTQWAVTLGLTLVVVYAVIVGALVVAGRRHTARALAGFVPDCAVLFRRLVSDERVPRRQKLVLGALAAYLAMPIDVVPDFVPVAGQLDDAIAVGVALRYLLRAAGPGLVEEHWPGPASSLRLVLALAGARPVAEHGSPTAPRR